MSWNLFVNGAGFAAPGLDSAMALAAHLAGAPLGETEGWVPNPTTLPSRQARRLSEASRIAIQAAEQIAEAVPEPAGWVFASSVGEGWTLNEILKALSRDEILIQPLRFQNAVHNAAQGQWSILAGSTGPASSIAAFDDTVGSGLLKAVLQSSLEGREIGLVCFDAPLPAPLHEKRPFGCPMATALALGRRQGPDCLARLEIRHLPRGMACDPADCALPRHLRDSNNPVRFALPLLEEVFRPRGRPITLSLSGGSVLEVVVREPGDAA